MKESWFNLLVILICITFLILGVFNAITYGKISAENKTVGDVTPEGAKALMIINIIICVIFLIPIFVYLRRFYSLAIKGSIFNWVDIGILLAIIAAFVLCIFNTITYGKIHAENKTVGDVTPAGAKALMVINIIIAAILIIPLIYYIYKMYKKSDHYDYNRKPTLTETEATPLLGRENKMRSPRQQEMYEESLIRENKMRSPRQQEMYEESLIKENKMRSPSREIMKEIMGTYVPPETPEMSELRKRIKMINNGMVESCQAASEMGMDVDECRRWEM
jgi:hypothetical protein